MPMKTFIFVDRIDPALQPLTADTCSALLPVAGKAVIEYTIEDLARAGIRQAVVVTSAYATQVEEHLGKGERWGMQFEYFPSRGGEHPAQLLRRYASSIEQPLLLVRGDVIRSSIAGFIETATGSSEPLVEARINNAAVGVCLCRNGTVALDTLEWPYTEAPGNVAANSSFGLQDASWSALDTLPAYHAANLDIAAGRYPGLKLAGWDRGNGLTVGRGSNVSSQSLAGEHSFVGQRSRVRASARLDGTSVISNNCFIDNQASIKDSVILPGTYVGENIEIRNAIVHGNQVIRIDSGASYHVADRFLLTQMQRQDSSLALQAFNRSAGVLLLLLSLPLWPVAAAGALLNAPAAPLRWQRFQSNKFDHDERQEPVRGSFSCAEWAVSAPVLKRLPLLLTVIGGHINLVGARPRTLANAPCGNDPWEQLAGDTQAGLLGPVQLDLPDDAPAEEGVLNEIYYSRYRSLPSDLNYLLKGARTMFSGRAWVEPRRASNH